MATYKIVRKFFDSNKDDEVIETGLTLEQAQEHCDDPETSSKTATTRRMKNITDKYGPWFDCWYKE